MGVIGDLTFNGVSASSLGVFVTGAGSFNAAAIDYTPYSVPGRSGDIIISNGRYTNIPITYPCFIPFQFNGEMSTQNGIKRRVQAVRSWLRSASGYAKLFDTYDPEHFRMAIPDGEQEFEPVWQNTGANFQIIFNCKPQRYFADSGEKLIVTASGRNMTNNTGQIWNPYYELTNPTIGARIISEQNGRLSGLTFTDNYTGTVIVDCETMNVYSGAQNLNNIVSGVFPIILPGVHRVVSKNFELGEAIIYANRGRWEL